MIPALALIFFEATGFGGLYFVNQMLETKENQTGYVQKRGTGWADGHEGRL